MRRTLLLVVALLVAMAVGRVITDTVPVADVDGSPFVVTGDVGQRVHLRYADLTVTRVRMASSLETIGSRVAPAGRFLVVDMTAVGRHEPQQLGFAQLDAADGRRFSPTTRGGCSLPTQSLPTALAWHVMYCFDVPRSALAGGVLEVSQGQPGMYGGQQRDDVAHVDLGLSSSRAASLWRSSTTYEGFSGGFDQPDLKPLPPATGTS